MSAIATPTPSPAPAAPPPTIGPDDVYYFREGSHSRLHRCMGAHLATLDGVAGAHFAVWAPNARAVRVIGDFNGWQDVSSLSARWDGSGIWTGFVPHASRGDCYKYRIESNHGGHVLEKGDPFATCWEAPPRTASRIWPLDFDWGDDAWMRSRGARNALDAPFSVYEVHLGSWMRPGPGHPSHGQSPDGGLPFLNYREIATRLADHVVAHGFTHVELMPVTEHPFYGSWGYQTTGYFAPTARYGTPQDFMCLVDTLHRRGIGVILDWVPSHYPNDAHGLHRFDGTALFEHEDPRQGFHPEWNSHIFNYGRNEVRAFLVSSAVSWLERYHIDGIRVDAVASMLYLDYARKHDEWVPNVHGGRENLEAVAFLKQLNATLYREFPDIQVIAEESTAWPMVSRPVDAGGLGFGMKWNMGWMHDTLAYLAREPVHRKHHQNQLTFSLVYAFNENFMLPLSHDEVVYGKKSLLEKMPGDDWQRFANLRLLLAYQWAHPGKKLLFMGGEIAQRSEWSHDGGIDWWLLEAPAHRGIADLVADLNRLHREVPALHQRDFDAGGFEWVDASDAAQSVLSFLRHAADGSPPVLVVCNFTPVPRHGYSVGVPRAGRWVELLNSDAGRYGGSGMGNFGEVEARDEPQHGRAASVRLTLPPLATLMLRPAA
ncbi:MAG: 1,4-alpha-glucan branching protein GlgB [Lautropia sp.]